MSSDSAMELRRAAEILGWELRVTGDGQRRDALLSAITLLIDKSEEMDEGRHE